MNITFYSLLQYFLIYSFLGWVMESIVRSIVEKKIVNTGFLYGPFCPIYGFGACIMLIFLGTFKDKVILLFLLSMVTLTLWEYIVGIVLEKIFKTKYWDYSDHKFNFQGRICLENSIAWGFLGVVFVYFIHPFIVNIVVQINPNLLQYSTYIILVLVIIDTIISTVVIKNMKLTLEKIEKISNEIKQKVNEAKGKTKNISEQEIEKLNKKKERMTENVFMKVYRLKQTFPALDTQEIRQILSTKLDKKNLEKFFKNKSKRGE